MFSDIGSLLEYVDLHAHAENRECEFKTGMSWDDLRLKIVKGVLAQANLIGGGLIIIGVSRNNQTLLHEPTGMSEEDSRTYDQDVISQYVNEFAGDYILE